VKRIKTAAAGAAVIVTALSSPALSHPHVFIDTAIEVLFAADGRAEGLRVHWTYDDFFSLTLVTDRGLDPDFDGALTPEEITALNGFDMQWHADFQGDTYALLAEQPLALSRPADWTVRYENGKLTSSHIRRFDAAIDLAGTPLVVQAYDPGYYTAYTVKAATVSGRSDCEVEVFAPDRAMADQILEDALSEYAGGGDAETDFPAVGSAYAEEARVTCSGD
jgi:ABC-type uncharacterized transport system substrate-binding protein